MPNVRLDRRIKYVLSKFKDYKLKQLILLLKMQKSRRNLDEVIWKKHQTYHQRAFCLRCTLGTFSALILLAVAGVAIAALVVTADQQSYQRFCMEMTDPSGEGNGTALGYISLRSNEREIEWQFQHHDLSGVPINIYIWGPIPVGQSTGPLAISLCGTPSTLACDISQVGFLKGLINESSPEGDGIKPIINAIRDNPSVFYATIGTSMFPNGEIAARFSSTCGTP